VQHKSLWDASKHIEFNAMCGAICAGASQKEPPRIICVCFLPRTKSKPAVKMDRKIQLLGIIHTYDCRHGPLISQTRAKYANQ